jgi:hypothetical protein
MLCAVCMNASIRLEQSNICFRVRVDVIDSSMQVPKSFLKTNTLTKNKLYRAGNSIWFPGAIKHILKY